MQRNANGTIKKNLMVVVIEVNISWSVAFHTLLADGDSKSEYQIPDISAGKSACFVLDLVLLPP